MAEVRAIDTTKRLVQIDSVSIPYDYLVLATGATHSYFGHDEWAEVAPGLKRIEDATRIRRHGAHDFIPLWLSQRPDARLIRLNSFSDTNPQPPASRTWAFTRSSHRLAQTELASPETNNRLPFFTLQPLAQRFDWLGHALEPDAGEQAAKRVAGSAVFAQVDALALRHAAFPLLQLDLKVVFYLAKVT